MQRVDQMVSNGSDGSSGSVGSLGEAATAGDVDCPFSICGSTQYSPIGGDGGIGEHWSKR